MGVVGFTVIEVAAGARPMNIALWYPSSGTPSAYAYPYLKGQVVANGPVESGSFPLLVVSHGVYECGAASATLLQAIAASGYIVAAPDHEDAANCLSVGGKSTVQSYDLSDLEASFPARPSEVSLTIDAALAHFAGRVDRVAVGGHSIGGWSSGRAADPRAEALLLWSPSARLEASVYAGFRAPLLYLFGRQEPLYYDQTWKWHAYESSPSSKYIGFVANAAHYAFTDKQTCKWYWSVEACLTYSAHTAQILEYSLAFLDWHLKGDEAALALLVGAMDRHDP